MVIGAAAGSFAVIRLGIGGALALDIATFCIAAVLYLRFAAQPQANPTASEGASHRELLRNLVSSRLVLGVTASFTVVTAAMGLLNATLPAFFDGKLAATDVYGYALAAIGAGAMVGELTVVLSFASSARAFDIVALGCVAGAALAAVALLRRPTTVGTVTTSLSVLDRAATAPETASSG